ncbi:hypothetical protein [Mesorhizobium salmacidum]|uniref:Lipoprotein n=1 Tax=Mesorhizobium salmacidum TaxID=3015171 RepID=A0ABU8KW19_9HYPH
MRMSVALISALVFLGACSVSKAENPSQEKCTCDTQPPQGVDGAWIKNATACWSTEAPEDQWCDMTVQSLEGDTAQSAVVATLMNNGENGSNLATIFGQQFQTFIKTAEQQGQLKFDVEEARTVVPALLRDNASRIEECVSAFRDATFGKGGVPLEGGSDFRCGVGASSGWLRIEFRVRDLWLAYMLAPQPREASP